MKTLIDYTSGKKFRVEIVSFESLSQRENFITCILDAKTMTEYNIYFDVDINTYFAVEVTQ